MKISDKLYDKQDRRYSKDSEVWNKAEAGL